MLVTVALTGLLATSALASISPVKRSPAAMMLTNSGSLIPRQSCPSGTVPCGTTCILVGDTCCPTAPDGETYSCNAVNPICSPDDSGRPGCCAALPCYGPGGTTGGSSSSAAPPSTTAAAAASTTAAAVYTSPAATGASVVYTTSCPPSATSNITVNATSSPLAFTGAASSVNAPLAMGVTVVVAGLAAMLL